MVSVMWFRRDLRLENNIALSQTFKRSDKLVLLFQINPEQFLENSLNHAAFFTSVLHFKNELEKKELHLHIAYGNVEENFDRVNQAIPDWTDIYFNQDEKGYGKKRR